MRERPILFSGPMVRAILDGRKTQTRRVVKPKLNDCGKYLHAGNAVLANKQIGEWRCQDGHWFGLSGYTTLAHTACPYGQMGDRLWVRESHWKFTGCAERGNRPWLGFVESPDGDPYRAICYDDSEILTAAKIHAACYRVPSIHMPRWASRILLEIVAVRVERLHGIGEADALAEGVMPLGDLGAIFAPAASAYSDLWESINGPGSWAADPWVWVVEFKRVTP